MRGRGAGAWCSVLGSVLLAGIAQGHDIWMTPESGSEGVQFVIHHGHPGDRKPPDPDKLVELRVIEPDGRDVKVPPAAAPGMLDGFPVLLPAPIQTKGRTGTWLFAARYDNGYWVKTESGHRNTSKLEVPGASESLHSMKFAKALVSVEKPTSMAHARVLGHRLELVPLDDPFSLKPGDKLRVLVLFAGKPLAHASVEIGDGVTPMKEADIPRYQTNDEGVAEVPIRKSGLQLVVVDHTVPFPHPDLADRELLAATLSFVLLPQ